MLEEDRQKLSDYYQEQGFFEVKVTPVTRPGNSLGEIDLTFVIYEGTRYTVRNLIIEGNSKIKTEALMEDLQLHSGKPFLDAVRDADKNRILIQYNEIGCIDTADRRRAAVHQPVAAWSTWCTRSTRASRTCWAS